MATYTEHYGLHQWLPEDNFLRSDFNEDFEKIDTAIRACSHVHGTYTGTGHTYAPSTQTISLGFRPAVVIIFSNFENYDGLYHMAMAFDGTPNNDATITDDGFEVTGNTNLAYRNDISQGYCNPYRYFAFR